MLTRAKLMTPQQAKDIEGRETTLRSRVLKDRVGSVRSQAAAKLRRVGRPRSSPPRRCRTRRRSTASSTRTRSRRCIAAAAGLRYVKIDPLKLDNALISKTFSRPFVRRHVVIPIGAGSATTSCSRSRTRSTPRCARRCRTSLRQPVRLRDLVEARHPRGRRPRVRPAHRASSRRASELGDRSPTAALVQMVQLRSQRGARHRERRDRRRRGRLPAELRVRAARVRHPPRAAPERRGGALPHRRHPARHRDVPARGARRRSSRA